MVKSLPLEKRNEQVGRVLQTSKSDQRHLFFLFSIHLIDAEAARRGSIQSRYLISLLYDTRR